MHEGSHTAQIGPYGPRLGKLSEDHALPDSFGDDALQEHFHSNAEFAASVQQETDLFLKAAAAKDDVEARLLVYEAREFRARRRDGARPHRRPGMEEACLR